MQRQAILASLCASVLAIDSVKAQVHWQRQATVASRAGHATAYDVHRQRTVLFGGFSDERILRDTWEWDGSTWTPIATPAAPALLGLCGLAYDVARRRMVLVGTTGTGTLEGWELDAGDWRPVSAPPGRWNQCRVAYDARRSVTVLVGSQVGIGTIEVWESGGGAWTQRGAGAGTELFLGPLVYDPARQRCVLLGITHGYESMTREWDGQAWTRTVTGTTPPPRRDHALAFDPVAQRVVVFGGTGNQGLLQDAWEWNGSVWTPRSTPGAPPPRSLSAMATDGARARLVLVAGSGPGLLGDTWEWDGSQWLQRAEESGPPRAEHALAFDAQRARLILFGGSPPFTGFRGDTWEWDGRTWHNPPTPVAPSPRLNHAMTWDADRGRAVLFGGVDGTSTRLGDTWEWDGTNWTQRATAIAPPGRSHHAMTYDRARGRVVLFGGYDGTRYLADTWEWDGQAWIRRHDGYPPAAWTAAMAYDTARQRTVLVTPGNGQMGAWEWDGSGWWSTSPAMSPPMEGLCSAAYDEARQRVVLLLQGLNTLDTWEWDGSAWTRTTTTPVPYPTTGPLLAWDAARERVLAYGGMRANVYPTHVNEYVSDRPASWRAFGAGCGPGAPSLSVVGRPWLGDTIQVTAVGLPGSAVRVLAVGASSTSWHGIPLPLSLAGLGFPACSLLVSLDLLQPLGSAAIPLPIPNAAELVGARFYQQALAIEPAPLTIALTQGAEGIIGAR